MVGKPHKHFQLPAEPPQSSIVAIVDTREQMPLDLSPLRAEFGTLPTGDYSVRGLEHVVAIERKSLGDLIGCVGHDRERFDREVMRIVAYPVRALVIESTWPELERAEWRGKVTASQAIGSVLGWIAAGLPVVMTGNHERAGRYVARLLYTAARRRWREARALVEFVADADPAGDPVETGTGA